MSQAPDNTRQNKALRKARSYLLESGWIQSCIEGASVDAAGRPIPWYRYAAIDFLRERVRPEHRVFEFGSGNSTHWWAQHARHVTAVEHDSAWAQRVAEEAAENVEILEVPLEPDGDYCRTPLRIGGKYEIIVIDGRDRTNCALQCLSALTDDGVVIWDDSWRNRYRRGLSFLAESGFRRLRFTGLGPIAPNPGETSILYRPVNCFEI